MSEEKVRNTKLKPRNHCMLPNAVNSFMVSNSRGAICGGILRQFYFWDEIFDIEKDDLPTLRYPTLFKSRMSANLHIANDRVYLDEIEMNCEAPLNV